MMPKAGLLCCVASLALACADADGGAVLQGGRTLDSASGTVALGIGSAGGTRAYRAVALASTGSIAGTITVRTPPDTEPPPARTLDTISASPGGRQQCAESADAPSAGGVLVWVEGVEAGKPLPGIRRGTLTIEDCRFAPRMMAVSTGTTINLFSADRATYTTRFYREGGAEPVATAHTVDAGQVVPSEKIADQPGFVEARRAEQPWARGYVAVFSHPYFAVADDAGHFKIDSLPPGTYTVKVWREGLGDPAEQRVVVAAGGTGRLDLSLTIP